MLASSVSRARVKAARKARASACRSPGARLSARSTSAATAGGIRPSVEALITREGVEDAMFGLWLGLLTTFRVVAMVLDQTEAELAEEVLVALEP